MPEAVQAILFTFWAPHLDLLGRPHPQRPAYEEPIEARTLLRFIETPTATAKKKTEANDKEQTLFLVQLCLAMLGLDHVLREECTCVRAKITPLLSGTTKKEDGFFEPRTHGNALELSDLLGV